jgi:uncharacterized protein DUF6600
MNPRRLVLLALLAAGLGRGFALAQSYPPPPPPDDRGYGNQPPYDDPYDAPYYDDQGPNGAYDQEAYDPGYYAYDTRGPVDVSFFYSSLHPYGRWLRRGSYGWVWEPTRVPVDWRPYTVGRWAMTDYGWTWVSEEPWGWATYHYGRWLFDPEFGWLWVPGTEWGPAWVSFQEGAGYIGWAPLPPSVGFRVGFGLQLGGLSLTAAITPYAYSFVPERAFLADRLGSFILPPARNVTLVRGTRNITDIRVIRDRVMNWGVPAQRIEQMTGRQVPRYRLTEVRNPTQAPVTKIQGDQVTLFRPAMRLARPRPEVTPQAVIERRVQERQAGPRPPQGGTPPVQPTWRRPAPQQEQAEPSQPAPQRQPRWQPQAGRPAPTPVDLERKHQAEQQRLQARQTEEQNRLRQLQESEQRAPQSNRGRAAQDLAAQHQAEMRALQDERQREQQLLQARQQREQQAANSRRNQGPPPQQQQDRPNPKGKERRRPEPPPPPPGS